MFHLCVKRPVAAVGVLVALTSVAACGAQGGAAALPAASKSAAGHVLSPASSSPSTTSTAAPAVQQALAAYRAAFADWASVETMPGKLDYQSPVLARHLSGQALSVVTRSVYVNTAVKGAVAKGTPLLHPTVGEVTPANDPTQVVVNDCVDTGSWLLWTSDGKHLYNDVPGGHQMAQSLVVLSDGAWKVSQLLMQPVGTCS
jgi:predicted small lipoprotein YifL